MHATLVDPSQKQATGPAKAPALPITEQARPLQHELERYPLSASHAPRERTQVPAPTASPKQPTSQALLDSANAWLQQASHSDLLSAEQEQALARRLAQARAGVPDETARQALIRANLRLVAFVARRFKNAAFPFEDLMQEGTIGLIHAVDRFDYRQGVRFSTYALCWIRQAILRALVERGALIRVPAHIQDSLRRLQQEHQRLSERLGRSPSLEEWTQAVGLTEEQGSELLSKAMSVVSLDAPAGPEQETRLADLIRAPEEDDPVTHVVHNSEGQALRQALGTLSKQEQELLTWRYGLEGDEPRSLEEISRMWRLSRERIRQMEVRALQKLRRHPLLQTQSVEA